MKKRPIYRTLKTSEKFKTRAEADEWAKKEKESLKATNQSPKIDIDHVEGQGFWIARILVKV